MKYHLHSAAEKGTLFKIPKKYLTENALLFENDSNFNCFQLAARRGCLTQIPKNLLTEKNLLEKNRYQNNSFHFAAGNGNLHQIPKKFLTPKNLLKRGFNEVTPLDIHRDGDVPWNQLSVRIWIPHLKELEKIAKGKDKLKKFIQQIKCLKRLETQPSLKV